MKMKKLLALALALSLAMSIFGAFEITASAEQTATNLSDVQILTLAKSKTPVFDSMNPKPSAASDTALSEAWSGWSGGNGNQPDDNGNYINVAGGDNPRIQMYRADGGNSSAPSSVIMPGYGEGSDYLLFGFTAEITADWGDAALMDMDGNYITVFRFGTTGLNPYYGHAGGYTPHNGKTNPFVMEPEPTGEPMGVNLNVDLVSGKTQVDVLCRKIDDSSYKAVFLIDGDIASTVTYQGTFNGIKSIRMSRGWSGGYSRISFLKPYIFTGNYTAESTYTVVYDGVDEPDTTVLTCEGMDEGYDGEKIFPNIEIPYFEGYVFKEKLVDASAQTVTLKYEPISDEKFFDNVAYDTTFVSLNMLGAHDAFTAAINGERKDAAGIAIGDGGSSAVALSSTSAKNASRAQTGDAYELLESGARYFDIRLSRSSHVSSSPSAPHTSNVFYTTHGVLSEEFRSIAYTIAQWAEQHHGEIIILDFQEVYDYAEARDGNADARTWRELDKILEESGIKDFVTVDNDTALNNVTYGSLTEDGTKAGIVLFGRHVAVDAGVGSFILRERDGKSGGKLYSNYTPSGASIGAGSFSEAYVNAQVNELWNTDTARMNNMFRVMQAQSEQRKILGIPTGDLITNAASDNPKTYTALKANKNWLSVLPVVMVNDAGTNTDDIVSLLKECNVEREYTLNCKTTDGNTFTATGKAMIGTLSPYSRRYGYVNGGDKRYYTTNDSPVATPYGEYGPFDVDVEEITSNVFTLINDGRVGSLGPENEKTEQDRNSLEKGDEDTGLNSFLAFNWGGAGTYHRIGAAILDVPKGSTFTLKATRYRNEGDDQNHMSNITLWALSLEDFEKLDNAKEVYATLNPENTVASATGEETKNFKTEIALDAEKIKKISGESGQIVVLGTGNRGLFGLSGDMHIEGGYKVAIDGKTQTYPAGEASVDAEGIAYSDEAGNVYTPKDGKLALNVQSDITLTKLTLGVKMHDGAQVRIGESYAGNIAKDSGLRFIGIVDKENTLAAIAQKAEDKEKNGIFVKITADKSGESILIPIKTYQDEEESFFTAVLTNLSTDNYNRLFTATPVVVVNGVTYEGTDGVSRSIFEVAAAFLVLDDESDDSVPGLTYEINDAVKAVLNAYVNSVGVRFGWDKQTGSLKGSPEDYYKYGRQDRTPVFFEVSVENEAEGAYIITIKPVGEAVIDEQALEKSLRINNNHTTAITYVDKDSIKKNEDGSVSFRFTPPPAE